ncbi:unnamed protein product, partial [Rotaria socialis]
DKPRSYRHNDEQNQTTNQQRQRTPRSQEQFGETRIQREHKNLCNTNNYL